MRRSLTAFAVAICMRCPACRLSTSMPARTSRAGAKSPGRFRATAGPRAARSVAPVNAAATMSKSMCGQRSASAIATAASADDDEVDRVADLDLMSERFAPLAPGGVIRIAEMPGRLRTYDLRMSDGSRHAAIGIAVSRRCDLLVAVAQGKGAAPEVQRVALEFLGIGCRDKMDDGCDGRAVKLTSLLPACGRAIAYGIFNRVVPANAGTHTARTHVSALEQRPFSLLRPGVMGPCVRRDDPLRDFGKPRPSAEVGHMR